MDRLVSIEEQRARMATILRECASALMVSIDGNGLLIYSYMNCNAVDLLGMSRALSEAAPGMAKGQGRIDEDG